VIRRTALRWPAVTLARAVFLARRAARVAAGAALVVLGVGGIPGAHLRSPARPWADDATPRVPPDLKDRDGRLDVTVTTLEGAPVAAAHVRALAMVDDRAYLADASDTDAGGLAHLAQLPRGEAWILVDAAGRARGATRLAIEPADGARSIALALGPEHALDVVVNDELGAAVAGASIEVASPVAAGADPLPVGARAGGDGRARVGRLGPGPWRATASAPGFEDAGGNGREGTALTLTLRKLGAIAAHVVGQDATPAAGARVAVAGATLWPARVAIADARGDVRIGGLAAGTYALRATKDDAVSPIELDVGLGRGEEKQVVLRLGRGRFVGVVVTDGDARDAAPIASARVTLAEGGLSPFPLEATTDRAGRARLGPIAPGTAALGARADGFMPRGAVAVPDPPPAETRVALVRAGTMTGRVLDARGRPVDGATIAIVGTDAVGQPIFDDPRRAGFQAAHFEAMLAGPAPLLPGGELGVIPGPVPPIPNGSVAAFAPAAPTTVADPWVTRSDGTFRASPASPGRVRVIVRHPQYVEAQSDLVTLAPGGEAHVDVVMREGGALDGRVLDAHDRPVAHARVVVTAARGDLERATRTASDGSFAFAALPEDVIVTASASADGQPDARLSVAVPEGGRREVTLVLPEPREALPVTIVDDRGYPVDAAQVSATSLTPGAWLRSTAFTDAHGDASLARGRGLALRVDVRAPSRAPRVVTTDGTEERLRVELTRAERAAGEVVAERGRDAIPGASITLYTDLGARRVQTDAHGTFALTDLAPGGARLSVRAPGFAPWTKPVAIPDSGGRSVFTIPRVELAAEGAIEGDVVDARGEPVAGARVARDRVPTWLLVGSNPADVAITDTTGHFTLRELPEGTSTVEAYAVGVGRARVGGVKVVAGRTTDGVRVAIGPADDDAVPAEVSASGSVAVTLGETDAPVAAIVVSVVEGSEAERAGLVPGDVLLTVDGAQVGGMAEARAKLSGPIGDDVVVEVRRGDGTLALRVPREAVRR
jgi:Carboxypeptidase regulatory-like domain/PDZ domain